MPLHLSFPTFRQMQHYALRFMLAILVLLVSILDWNLGAITAPGQEALGIAILLAVTVFLFVVVLRLKSGIALYPAILNGWWGFILMLLVGLGWYVVGYYQSTSAGTFWHTALGITTLLAMYEIMLGFTEGDILLPRK